MNTEKDSQSYTGREKENDLPTKAEYDWYIALSIMGRYYGHCVGTQDYLKYKEIERKARNIKYPATIEEIYAQLK